ncbi:MAG: hypothetical protein P4K78_13850 [Terracidiphilus sp.]|nr:hypothetical protein [Terracidiphilus sp.]
MTKQVQAKLGDWDQQSTVTGSEKRLAIQPVAWIHYANEELMLLNTFVVAVATWFTPLIAARAIKQTRRAYSTKSWPCSSLISRWNFTYSLKDRSLIWSFPIASRMCETRASFSQSSPYVLRQYTSEQIKALRSGWLNGWITPLL